MSPPNTGELSARLRERRRPGNWSDVFVGDPLCIEAAEALTTLERELEAARTERDALIKSTGEHITVRSEYLARATAAQAEVERLKEALGHHERLLLINSVRNAAKSEAPLWLEAADHAAESVRAQVEEAKP